MREHLPVLSFVLEEAQRLVEDRLNLGRELLALGVRDKATLDNARHRYQSWDDYNCDLLRKLLRSDKFVDEYVDRIAFWDGPHTLAEEIQEFRADIQRKLRRLESIRDRLHLFKPDTPTPVLVIHDEELRNRTADLLVS